MSALKALGDSVGAAGADLAAKKDELSAAVVANTPAAPSKPADSAPPADAAAATPDASATPSA